MVNKMIDEDIYFITGAAGFVGAHLLKRLLEENVETHVLLKRETDVWRIQSYLNHPKMHVHYGSLADKPEITKLLNEIHPTVIYHLAARGAYSSQNNAQEIFETNLFGTLHLLDAVKELPIKLFVHTSSSSEYGKKDLPMTENDVLEPDSFYAVSKVAATHLCRIYQENYRLPLVTLRLFSVYGPLEDEGRLMPKLMHALKNNEDLDMVNPDTARDFIYIDDVIDLYRQVDLLAAHPGVYNVGTGVQTSLKKLSEVALHISNSTMTFNWQQMPPKTWDKPNWVANMKLTNTVLNWQPPTNLETGLRKMWLCYTQ